MITKHSPSFLIQSLNLIVHLFLSILLFEPNLLLALTEEELKAYNQIGKDIGKDMQREIADSFSDSNSKQIQESVGYDKSAEVRGNGIGISGAEALSAKVMSFNDEKTLKETQGERVNYECNKEHCDVGDTFSSLLLQKRKAELEMRGFTKDENNMQASKSGYLDKALKVVKDSSRKDNRQDKNNGNSNEFDFLTASQNSCKSISETITSTTEEGTCDRYYDLQVNSCFPKQVVEIDPEYTYSCNKIRNERVKICHDKITSIECKESQECGIGGIEKGTIASDMKFEISNGVITIGTIADNYWPGDCTIYDRHTSFKIKNKYLIKEFKLFRIGFDDYMLIKLNNHLLYVGPYGGEKLETIDKEVDYGHKLKGCELGTSWVQDVNIDLRPYLKEGENILFTRVVVAGHGEGWLQIKAKQSCCKEWDIKRGEICDVS